MIVILFTITFLIFIKRKQDFNMCINQQQEAINYHNDIMMNENQNLKNLQSNIEEDVHEKKM